MEILLGAIISILTEGIKKLSEKLGKKMTGNIILISVFILSLGGSYIYSKGLISQEFLKEASTIFALSITWFEVIYKRIIIKILEKSPDAV